jgi:hypothetical protein
MKLGYFSHWNKRFVFLHNTNQAFGFLLPIRRNYLKNRGCFFSLGKGPLRRLKERCITFNWIFLRAVRMGGGWDRIRQVYNYLKLFEFAVYYWKLRLKRKIKLKVRFIDL